MTMRLVAVARVTMSGIMVLAVARSMALVINAILSFASAGMACIGVAMVSVWEMLGAKSLGVVSMSRVAVVPVTRVSMVAGMTVALAMTAMTMTVVSVVFAMIRGMFSNILIYDISVRGVRVSDWHRVVVIVAVMAMVTVMSMACVLNSLSNGGE